MDFLEFPKISRFSRDVWITEKIDGTNAQVYITEDGQIFFGSRTRWITPEGDNYGFARWGMEHREELITLGPGRHFGEWWGQGIQRKYGLTEKRFSLFNAERWGGEDRPACCHVVPVLYKGPLCDGSVEGCLLELVYKGSKAAPGFMKPEGVVIYHTSGRVSFKKTIEHDDEPKSRRQ